MSRHTLLRNIKNCLGNATGLNFHTKITSCLKLYCRYNNIEHTATKQMGGDGGVDFLIPDSNTYFAISGYTDTSLDNTLKKINQDLSRITKCVIKDKEYTTQINNFIFIYNTFGDEKANDRNHKIEDLFKNYFRKFYKFRYVIWNVEDFVFELEKKCTDDILEKINEELNLLDLDNSPLIIEEIREVLNKVEDVPFVKQNYERKSTKQKIDENNLHIIKQQINDLLTNVWYAKLEEVIQENEYYKKFSNFKEAVVELYDLGKSKYKGVQLFENIISEVSKRFNCSNSTSKLLVTYLFDRCDIF